jgi:hypothetical protein
MRPCRHYPAESKFKDCILVTMPGKRPLGDGAKPASPGRRNRRFLSLEPLPMGIDLTTLRVAIVHYWFFEKRGGEKVVEALCELFPGADIFTHILDRKIFSNLVAKHKVTTSFIQRLPYAHKVGKYYLSLMPLALEQFDLSDYDLIISSESGPAKGIIVRQESVYIATAILRCVMFGTITPIKSAGRRPFCHGRWVFLPITCRWWTTLPRLASTNSSRTPRRWLGESRNITDGHPV